MLQQSLVVSLLLSDMRADDPRDFKAVEAAIRERIKNRFIPDNYRRRSRRDGVSADAVRGASLGTRLAFVRDRKVSSERAFYSAGRVVPCGWVWLGD